MEGRGDGGPVLPGVDTAGAAACGSLASDDANCPGPESDAPSFWTYRLEGLTAEEWKMRNCCLKSDLAEHQEQLTNLQREAGTNRILSTLLELIRTTLWAEYRKGGAQEEERQSPLEKFRKKRLALPELSELIHAESEGGQHREKQLHFQIIRDDWRGYLREVSASNAGALFRYL